MSDGSKKDDPFRTANLASYVKDQSPANIQGKLVVMDGPDAGTEVALESLTIVGSDPSCQLELRDTTVSRKHLTVEVSGNRIRIEDMGSRNGTFLGDTRVLEAEVHLGTVLRVGRTTLAIQPRWFLRELPPSRARRFGELVGEAVATREIFAILERISPTDVTVLVEGESGTGKELVCRSIHEASERSERPYVVFDCGAVPRDLAESELFGHKKGAFTGADSDREGAFQRADGGTICLDEIGELPLELQPRLLRALENGEVRPVGADRVRKVDVRVLAATNRNLSAEVQAERFRADLLYRLEVVRLRVPPLRDRPEDIPLLVSHFLGEKASFDDEPSRVNLERLMAYTWPGNVRELRNSLSRAVALHRKPEGETRRFPYLLFNLGPPTDSPHTIGQSFPGVVVPLEYKEAKAKLLEMFDHAYVEAVLARHEGNVTRAAEAAGLSRKHLYALMRRSTGVDPID